MNYYNECDPFAADWLENLIAAGLIPHGFVDRRSIKEVQPDDLQGFTQCHFFAGIGGWCEALRLAGVAPTVPLWTGSCPCQSFSIAGKGKGKDDPRHLWPDFFRLIRKRRPELVIGEQVSHAIGHGWLDGVFTDLEGEAYTSGAVVLGAHSVGLPHVRPRLYWLAYTGPSPSWNDAAREGAGSRDGEAGEPEGCKPGESGRCGSDCERLANTSGQRIRASRSGENGSQASGVQGANGERKWVRADAGAVRTFESAGMGNASSTGLEERIGDGRTESSQARTIAREAFELASCRDGKQRRFEPGAFPLAHGIPRKLGHLKPELAAMAPAARSNRIGRLRGYGNAIVPAVAAEFICAFMECVPSGSANES